MVTLLGEGTMNTYDVAQRHRAHQSRALLAAPEVRGDLKHEFGLDTANEKADRSESEWEQLSTSLGTAVSFRIGAQKQASRRSDGED